MVTGAVKRLAVVEDVAGVDERREIFRVVVGLELDVFIVEVELVKEVVAVVDAVDVVRVVERVVLEEEVVVDDL